MLSDEMLKQAAEELALAIIESLPKPEQYQHQFSERFNQKMQVFFSHLPTATDGDKSKMP